MSSAGTSRYAAPEVFYDQPYILKVIYIHLLSLMGDDVSEKAIWEVQCA
jgi:hypothetical protein